MKFSFDTLKDKIDKEKVGNWIAEYKRQAAVGCILVCLFVVAVVSLTGKETKAQEADGAETSGGALTTILSGEEEIITDVPNLLEQDAYPAVNEIVEQYYSYMSSGDMEGLAAVVDEISEEEKNRILSSKDLVEGYENIACYTKRGMEEGSYVVFVYYEQKFVNIETAAPGLTTLYVCTDEEENLYIFNGAVSDDLKAYVEALAEDDDVKVLKEEVKAKYEEAKTADEGLAKLEERAKKTSNETEEPVETADASGEESAGELSEETGEGEDTSEETAEETAEGTAEEETTEGETGDDSEEAAAQNRDTRFTESVRLRAGRGTDTEYLGTAYQGEHVTQIESYSDGWSKIRYNDTECYCMTEFLE